MQTFSTLADFAASHEVDMTKARGQARWRIMDRAGTWFYKRLTAVPSVTRWPTPISELLASDLLDRLELPTVATSLIRVEEGPRWILKLRAVRWATPGAVVASETALIDAGLWKLFLFDLLVGNGDRSLANLLTTDSPPRYVPIDHELALLTPSAVRPGCPYFHFVPPEGRRTPTRTDAYGRALDKELGTPVAVAHPNRIYRRLLSPDDELRARMICWSADTRTILTADWLDDRLGGLPDVLFPGDAAGDRQYVRQTLSARLEWLPDAIADLSSASRAPAIASKDVAQHLRARALRITTAGTGTEPGSARCSRGAQGGTR